MAMVNEPSVFYCIRTGWFIPYMSAAPDQSLGLTFTVFSQPFLSQDREVYGNW